MSLNPLAKYLAAKEREAVEWKSRAEAAEAELAAVGNTLPGNYYMDPPDGGDVSIAEQVRRMGEDARRYRWLRERHWSQGSLCVISDVRGRGTLLGMDCPSLDRLDAAIDSELEKEKTP